MVLNIRILYTNGTIEHKTLKAPRYRKATSAMVYLGTNLRASNPTVAAIRSTETGTTYEWVGHYTPLHMAAINAAPKGW